MYSVDEIKQASATARNNGAVGSKAVIPQLVRGMITPTDKVLDYGAGYGQHTLLLRDEGYKVDAYDFNPRNSVHHPYFVSPVTNTYDLVYASNVLNVQDSVDMMNRTIEHIASLLIWDGIFVSNFPKTPRKCETITDQFLVDLLREKFENVTIKKYSSGTIFICSNPV